MRRRNPTRPRRHSLITTFWSLVDKAGPLVRDELGPCWMWTGGSWVGDTGISYGLFSIGKNKELAHRFSYEIANGPLGANRLALHHCDNPPCVNPAHLYAGTPQENGADRRRRPRERLRYSSISERYSNRPFSDLLDDRNLSISDLARITGINAGMLSRIGHCVGSLGPANFSRLAAVIGEDRARSVRDAVGEKRNVKVTDDVHRQIVAWLDEGINQREVSERGGLSWQTIHRIAMKTRHAGRRPCRRRAMDPSKRSNKYGLTPDKILAMRALHREGLNAAEIGRRFAVPQPTAWSIVHCRAFAWVREGGGANGEAA